MSERSTSELRPAPKKKDCPSQEDNTYAKAVATTPTEAAKPSSDDTPSTSDSDVDKERKREKKERKKKEKEQKKLEDVFVVRPHQVQTKESIVGCHSECPPIKFTNIDSTHHRSYDIHGLRTKNIDSNLAYNGF